MGSIVYIFVLTSFFSIVMCHVDFRARFMERKREREIKDDRMKLLDKYLLSDTETVDGVTHYKKIDKGPNDEQSKKRQAIEIDFRKLIGMVGMKYDYKRDFHWRTWRKVVSDDGSEEFISYKCNNPIQDGAKAYENCGMWTIEEHPPCPYELFSVINDQKLCGANYTQFHNIHGFCPSVIKFSDLVATCDNPIETVWRFTKLYGGDEQYNSIICRGEDYCEIFTSYQITPQQVIFRIINSSNSVVYSKIMKPNNENYYCTDDCGELNPETGKIIKNDKPLKLDLLAPRINKRENTWSTVDDFDMGPSLDHVSMSKNGGKFVTIKPFAEETYQHDNEENVSVWRDFLSRVASLAGVPVPSVFGLG